MFTLKRNYLMLLQFYIYQFNIDNSMNCFATLIKSKHKILGHYINLSLADRSVEFIIEITALPDSDVLLLDRPSIIRELKAVLILNNSLPYFRCYIKYKINNSTACSIFIYTRK
jgi:hypothetical protein